MLNIVKALVFVFACNHDTIAHVFFIDFGVKKLVFTVYFAVFKLVRMVKFTFAMTFLVAIDFLLLLYYKQ